VSSMRTMCHRATDHDERHGRGYLWPMPCAVAAVRWPIFRTGVVLILLLLHGPLHAAAPDSLPNICHRSCLVWRGALIGGAMAGTLVALDQAWYSGYARGGLHAFNDGHEWLGMDKAGHMFSAYTL